VKRLSKLQDYFYEKIYPDLEYLELKRKEIYSFLKKTAVVIFIFVCMVFYSLVDVFTNTFNLIILCATLSFGLFALRYSKMGMISKYEYEESSLFSQSVDRYSGDDLVAGKIDGVDISFSEVHTEAKRSKNRRGEHWQTIFKGLFFIADFNKNFKGKTIILPDKSEKFLGSFSHYFQSFSSRGELVKMDSPEFEKEFVVYSDDQIEARYILSHSLMNSILEYKKLVDKNIHISFIGSSIYIAIGFKKKLFEPKIYKKVTSFDEVRFYYEVLSLASSIVGHLNLNRRIWSKR